MVLTHDTNIMTAFAMERVTRGEPRPECSSFIRMAPAS